jgi:hypothetical protein
MRATQDYKRHSADIRMQLAVNGHTFVIGHLGPEFVILRNPIDHPPAQGEITMSVDGRVRRWRVQLPEGISAHKPRTRIQDQQPTRVE